MEHGTANELGPGAVSLQREEGAGRKNVAPGMPELAPLPANGDRSGCFFAQGRERHGSRKEFFCYNYVSAFPSAGVLRTRQFLYLREHTDGVG